MNACSDEELNDWLSARYHEHAGRNFVGDPQMTVMLMELGPICAIRARPLSWIAFKPNFSLDGPGDRADWPKRLRLGRAVAEAAALALGYGNITLTRKRRRL